MRFIARPCRVPRAVVVEPERANASRRHLVTEAPQCVVSMQVVAAEWRAYDNSGPSESRFGDVKHPKQWSLLGSEPDRLDLRWTACRHPSIRGGLRATRRCVTCQRARSNVGRQLRADGLGERRRQIPCRSFPETLHVDSGRAVGRNSHISVRASSQCPTPILQKRHTCYRHSAYPSDSRGVESRVSKPQSDVRPLQIEPAALLWSQKSRSVRG